MLTKGGLSALFATITRWSAESKQSSSARLLGLLHVLTVEIGLVAPAGTETGFTVFASKTQTRLSPSPTQIWLLSTVSTPSGPETSLLATHVPPVGGPHTKCVTLSMPRAPTNVFGWPAGTGGRLAEIGWISLTAFESVLMTSTDLLLRSPR